MKLKSGYVLNEIASEGILIPVNGDVVSMNTAFCLNEIGRILLEKLIDGCEKQDLIDKILTEYDTDEQTARAETDEFIARLLELQLIEA